MHKKKQVIDLQENILRIEGLNIIYLMLQFFSIKLIKVKVSLPLLRHYNAYGKVTTITCWIIKNVLTLIDIKLY